MVRTLPSAFRLAPAVLIYSTVFLSEFADQILINKDVKPVFDLICAEYSANWLFFSKTMKKTLFASFSNLCVLLKCCVYMHASACTSGFVSQSRTFLIQRWQGASAKINAFCFVIKHRTYGVFRSDVAFYFL